MQIRVYYEDTDAGGIVYHSNYLNFCERARSEYFFRKDMLPIIDGSHFVVRKMSCDFVASARFGDVIDVKTKLGEIKGASFEIEQKIYKGEQLLFSAKVLLVLVNNGKVKKLTQDIQNLLTALFW